MERCSYEKNYFIIIAYSFGFLSGCGENEFIGKECFIGHKYGWGTSFIGNS